MSGDFTSVPLRDAERWTAVRMQQGRVLLDTDVNLASDGAARETRALARDAIGAAGVPVGSTAFEVVVQGGALVVRAGTMWIGGMLARNPTDVAYLTQPEVPALPASGLAVLYLDAFLEEVSAAEDASLLDPALDRVDTTTRTRVGWRVRAVPTSSTSCTGAALPAAVSTGRLDVVRTTAPPSADPCAPPDDPRSKLPDGLLRIEVLDAGTESTARFAWSYVNGSDAVAASVAGTAVTLAPSPSVVFAPGDLVEVSTLARRADRRDAGALLGIADVTPSPGGDIVTLATASPLVGNPPGTCLRRWDGSSVGAAAAVPATIAGADVGISFTAQPGSYLPGDWWGVRVRGSAADAVELRTGAPPDGVVHALAPLAVVDVGTLAVVSDCRRTFPSLVDLRGGTCTVTAFPGDDLQAALDALPDEGGELCLAAGEYVVDATLTVEDKRRVVVTGVGPATVLVAARLEAVLQATDCDDIEITRLRVESGRSDKASPPGDQHLLGALTFVGGDRVRVTDCQVRCPDGNGRIQSGICVSSGLRNQPGEVEVRGNALEIGSLQVGILVASARETTIIDNTVVLAASDGQERVTRTMATELGRYVARHVELAAQQPRGKRMRLPDEREADVDGPAQISRFIADWAAKTSRGRLGRERSLRQALIRHTVASAMEAHEATVSSASARFLAASLKGSRAVGQGIVVGGSRADAVRIEGNVVTGALQGIHVGLQDQGDRRLVAGRVLLRANRVLCRVPFFWERQRHAVYIGNVASLTVLDTTAVLVRTGDSRDGTPVDAVRVWGELGPFLHVRGVDLTGEFRTGVLVRNLSQGRNRSVQHVSDVLNLDGGAAVDVPAQISTERCVP